ncbi:helicase-related protein [Asticcacaulis sp. BYS171W]|uniref:Helicase-related protein n=1 Tax=Asticcacaulis aquaticus TaxID=2984212 RepID=A0ABT5HQ82_9CAUL|nr:helicase-related protein [Asticcacaulis aquaticus]
MPDLSHPPSDLFAREERDHRLVAVLGPTNTGKTHYALERMMAHGTGMIGLPLRLLAREIYDRVVKEKGVNAVALITGEEKIIPRLPAYFICTVEAMPLERRVDFLAVDEIQLCADTERGHVFTDRLLHARGYQETLFMGAKTFAPLFRSLFPHAEILFRERLSQLKYAGPKKLTRLPPRTAIVAFSTEQVYAIAELIRRQRGGAAVVMGSLSPKTRNAQVDLFQRGEVDFLVATDAIGMGLNMDIDHVAFAGLSKFDGKRTRPLTAQEAAQIAGRAGRFKKEGTFGVTGDAPEMDEDLVEAIEHHRFLSLTAAQWRNHKLDFSSLDHLLKSLTAPSPLPALHLAKEALDEKALRHLSQDEDIALKARNPVSLRILWEVCQLPDFRKVSLDEHLKMVSFLFWSRMRPDGFVQADWFDEQLSHLDRLEGDIDTLSGRLSGVRTLSYIANRTNWLKNADHWRGATRDLEARLSDKLHEALMKRFVDQRTSALLKALNAFETPKPEVTAAGEVILEGHTVGHLRGLNFVQSSGETLVEDKALRQAAHRAVTPILKDRLNELSQAPTKTLRLHGANILWRGEVVGQIEPSDYFNPKVRLECQTDHAALQQRVAKRLVDFVRQQALQQLKPLHRVYQASRDESLPAAVRAVAYQLYENGGIVLRRDDKLTPEERKALRDLGVQANRFVWTLPRLPHHLMQAFGGARDHPQRALSLKGLVAVADHKPVKLKTLAAIDKALSECQFHKGAVYLKPDALKDIANDRLMQALGFAKTGTHSFGEGDERTGWRTKSAAAPKKAKPEPAYVNPYSPFAVLRAK